MCAACVGSWLVVAGLIGVGASPEVLYGMCGPLAVASISWMATERTFVSNPERLTGVMVKGLAIKVVFFGVYAVYMLRVLAVRPMPFVLSFTSYFIALHLTEALFMRRMFARAGHIRTVDAATTTRD